MARIIATTDRSERRHAPTGESAMSGTNLLTVRQIRRMEKLPDGHKVVRVRYGVPIVRRSDGRLLRMRTNGRLVMTAPVESVQSYLDVRG